MVAKVWLESMTELENAETGTAAFPETTSVPLVVEYPEIRLKLSEDPVNATCPYCHQSMVTDIETHPGPFTLLTAIIMAHCLLCCVPFLVDRFKDVKHHCSKCKSTIGIFRKI